MEEATYQLVHDFFRQQYYHQQILTQPNHGTKFKRGSFHDQTTNDKNNCLQFYCTCSKNKQSCKEENMKLQSSIIHEFESARINWNLQKLWLWEHNAQYTVPYAYKISEYEKVYNYIHYIMWETKKVKSPFITDTTCFLLHRSPTFL